MGHAQEHVRKVAWIVKRHAVLSRSHDFGEHRRVVKYRDGHAAAAKVGKLHRKIQTRRGLMKTEPEVRHPDQLWIIRRLEP